MNTRVKAYCIGHVAPTFEAPIQFQILCPQPTGMKNEIIIEDNRFGQNIDGSSLAEYSQLFGLAKMIEAGDIQADNLFLFQYRKFISPIQGGVEATASWLRVLSPETAKPIFPSTQILDEINSKIIIGSMLELKSSIAQNYALAHVIDDLVLFSAACAKCPELESKDIISLTTMQGFIPSPALCYIKTDIFIKIMSILESTWKEFSKNYHIQREGYQRRVAGYLLERLHSILIFNMILNESEPAVHLWQRYVVIK